MPSLFFGFLIEFSLHSSCPKTHLSSIALPSLAAFPFAVSSKTAQIGSEFLFFPVTQTSVRPSSIFSSLLKLWLLLPLDFHVGYKLGVDGFGPVYQNGGAEGEWRS